MKSRAFIAVLVLAVAAVAVYAGRRYFAGAESASLDHSSETHEKVTEISGSKLIKLPPHKLKAAGVFALKRRRPASSMNPIGAAPSFPPTFSDET